MSIFFKKINKKIRQPLYLIIAMMIAWYCFFGHKYQFTYSHGISMQPTHLDGEWVVVEKRSYLSKGWKPDWLDIVVIFDEESGDKLTKRVIGLEGDTIEIKEGVIYLNDKKLEEPYGRGKILVYLVDENNNNLKYWEGEKAGGPVVELTNEKAKKIPEGNVWVIGDNREASWYGVLPINKIKGLVIF